MPSAFSERRSNEMAGHCGSNHGSSFWVGDCARAARYFLAPVLCSCVANRATTTTFVVEHTDYGWSVGAGTERMGLFVTQRQALDAVKKRRAELAAKGQRSTVIVTGSEPVTTGKRTYWSRR
jgi:hypothetical protein